LSIPQLSRDEKKFTGHKIDLGASDRVAQAANDRKLTARRDFAWRIESPFLNFEQCTF